MVLLEKLQIKSKNDKMYHKSDFHAIIFWCYTVVALKIIINQEIWYCYQKLRLPNETKPKIMM